MSTLRVHVHAGYVGPHPVRRRHDGDGPAAHRAHLTEVRLYRLRLRGDRRPGRQERAQRFAERRAAR